MLKLSSTLFLTFAAVGLALAHLPPGHHKPPATFRQACNPGKAGKDLAINNVRARLWSAGDLWWEVRDGSSQGRYIVPKVAPGEPEVSAIYAAALWLGGIDAGGNLRLAAQTYGRGNGRADYWPGPLTPAGHPLPGTTDPQSCMDWDKIFSVTAQEIDEHRRLWRLSISTGRPYRLEMMPKSVLGWPGKDNPHFAGYWAYALPQGSGLAPFWDENGDGVYDPLQGDYPILDLYRCSQPHYPDEMAFWIFNDNGNDHTSSGGAPLQMEFHATSFAYATDDELNDMTFLRYKLISRAIEPLDSLFLGLWADFDLGCPVDDYIGCDTLRNMAYVYNEDAVDGEPGCACPQGINTYCDKVPVFGIDLLRGPLGHKKIGPDGALLNPAIGEAGDTIVELGMSSFTYYITWGWDPLPPGMANPSSDLEYYRHLTGHWRDGSPITFGFDGFQTGGMPTKYVFPGAPDDPEGWSVCNDPWPASYRVNIQSSGPFRLSPGQINEAVFGMIWVPDQPHPCPSLRPLQQASDRAQAAFDHCFELLAGPDAPDLDIIELDRELILVLTNDEGRSNNAFEGYREVDYFSPLEAENRAYAFEGYQLYQLAGPEVFFSAEAAADPAQARLIFQADRRNGVGRIFNWGAADSPAAGLFFTPQLMVDGRDEGIRRTFRVTEDAFAESDRRLVNHKKYYFVAVAYAHNEYEPFDPDLLLGQRQPYLLGRGNIGDWSAGHPSYVAIPRPITDRALNAAFGKGTVIARADGLGTGQNFLDLSAETRGALEEAFANNERYSGDLVYAPGRGPIAIQIFNPLEVQDGSFELKFVDRDLSDDQLDPDARWELRKLDEPGGAPIVAEKSIAQLNEQIIRQYGFSIAIGQVAEPGSQTDQSNGYIGYEVVYADPAASPWMHFIPDGFDPTGFFELDNFMYDYFGTSDNVFDPDGGLRQFGQTPLMPYFLLDWRARNEFDLPFINPVWTNNSASGIVRNQMSLANLNNVDLVFTPHKNLWSRCVIIESANRFYTGQGFQTEGSRQQFDLRFGLSVSKEAGPDGLPLPDGAIDTDQNGNPILIGGQAALQRGMGWFPGYAVDVETGQRLNVFFGENSVYDGSLLPEAFAEGPAGRDMMFNPTSQLLLPADLGSIPYPYYTGGQHTVYITRTPYDGCELFRLNLRPGPSPLTKIRAMREITWAGTILMREGVRLNSYADGLIPDGLIIKMRVANPYQVETDDPAFAGDQRTGSGEHNFHPLYRFQIEGKQAGPLTPALVESALDYINVVPNPYYGFSDYEGGPTDGRVKITNLPARCDVAIYTLEGKLVRRYKRDEAGLVPVGGNRAIERGQIAPALEWDLRNARGEPVASGVYLIHVSAPGLGERTLKWFGAVRELD